MTDENSDVKDILYGNVKDILVQIQRDQQRFERKQRRSRRVAFAFFPFYIIGGGIIGWGISRVDDPLTWLCIVVGLFLVVVLGQWAQPFWLAYLTRKHSADDRSTEGTEP